MSDGGQVRKRVEMATLNPGKDRLQGGPTGRLQTARGSQCVLPAENILQLGEDPGLCFVLGLCYPDG